MKARYVATSLKEAASVFGVQVETVRAWISKGCPCVVGTSPEGGQYDIAQMIRWCRKHVWVPKQNGRGSSGSDQTEADLRKKILQLTYSDKALSLKARMGLLIDREDAIATVMRQYAIVRGRLEELPQEAASMVPPHMKADVIAQWKHLIHLALKELAGLRHERYDENPDAAN